MDPITQTKKLSIVIPAFNEQMRIGITMEEVYEAAKNLLDEFEIIVIDDGSTDDTQKVAQDTAKKLGNEIKILRQTANQGVGAAFQLGLENANFPQLCLVPGDNAYCKSGIESLFCQCGTTPLVISYRQNMNARTPLRHLLSIMATLSLRVITGLKIRDAHSLYLFPVDQTRKLGVKASGYGYHIEILSRLLKKNNKSFVQVPVTLNPKPDASSGIMKPKTLFFLGLRICKLFLFRMMGKL